MVEIVANWLKLFRDTTTRMSTRDKTTISSVYAVFLGIQDNVRQHLKLWPETFSLHQVSFT
jgi:hypothetical protein